MFSIQGVGRIGVATLLMVAVATATVPVKASVTSAPQTHFGLTYRWHTFYAGVGTVNDLRSIGSDGQGNVYVVGHSNDSWGNPLRPRNDGASYDVIIIKLTPNGEYIWHTYFGGIPAPAEDADDEAAAMVVDAAGNLYITGYSDRTWQGPANQDPLAPHGGDSEYMFVLKLDANGSYQWHTFFQPGRALAITLAGDALYVSGEAVRTWGDPKHATEGRLVLTKLTATGQYAWHTYYGVGSWDELANAVAVDQSSGMVYMAGQTANGWLGANGEAALNGFSGGADFSFDIFVIKLSADGAYQWHTFYGVADTDDIANGIAIDHGGNVFVVGQTYGGWGTPLNPPRGERDIVLLKLAANGAYAWHTNIGADGNDYSSASLWIKDDGLIVAGESSSPWLGPANQEPVHPHGGYSEIVVAKFNFAGGYVRHTFFGTEMGQDRAHALALDPMGDLLITGRSNASWLGGGARSPIHPYGGNINGEGFVLKLSDHVNHVVLPIVTR